MALFRRLYSKVRERFDDYRWIPPTILLCYYPNIYLDDFIRRSWLPRARQSSAASLSLILQALLIIGPLLNFLLLKYSILDISELRLWKATQYKNGQFCNCAHDTSNCPQHLDQSKLPETDIRTGLNQKAISTHRRRYGRHEAWKGINWPLWALKFCSNPVQTFILAGAVLAVSLREWLHFGLVCLLWLLMIDIRLHQQKDYVDLAATLTTSPRPTIVLRDGNLQEVSNAELVPGDIVHVSEGAMTPADGIVVASNDLLELDQSNITGEELPVHMDDGDKCLYSTGVVRGEAFLQVESTGWNTFIGRIIRYLRGTEAESKTYKELVSAKDFMTVIQSIGAIMLVISALPALLWQMSVSGFESWSEMFSLIAEMAIIASRYFSTSSLVTIRVSGLSDLASEGCVAQDIEAMETLAGIDTLCVDNTGTITENSHTLLRPYCVSCDLEVLILAVGDAPAFTGGGVGRAIATALKQFPHSKARRDRYRLIDRQESDFDAGRAYTQCLVEASDGTRYFYASGRPGAIVELCRKATLTEAAYEENFKEAVDTFIDSGFFTIGVAQRREGGEWQLLGGLPFLDPPRASTKPAIKQADALGIRLKIMSAGSLALIEKTARAVGLDPSVLDTENIDQLQKDPSGNLAKLVDRANVYAGLNTKARGTVLTILQNDGHRVAITGDSASQTTALRKAECGMATAGASEAAQSAGDLVFTGKGPTWGLPPLISAIRFSRQVHQHAHNYVVWQTVRTLHVLLTMLLVFVAEKRLLDMRLLLINSVCVELLLLSQRARPNIIDTPYPRRPTRWSRARALREISPLVVVMVSGSCLCVYALTLSERLPALPLFLALGDLPVHLLMHTDGRIWRARHNWKVLSTRVAIHLLTTMLCVAGWAGAPFHMRANSAGQVWLYSLMTSLAAGTVQYATCSAAHLDLPQRE